MKVIISVTVVLTLSLAIDWIYQVVRKPSELFFPVNGTLYKTASETWRQYAPIFRKYSTNMITPELLAAIAQVEGSGNPVVRTYWRWSWTSQPFEVYRPASSAADIAATTGRRASPSKSVAHRHRSARRQAQYAWTSYRR
jgi:hypothetical protein